ncbi:MAG TPA: carbamoyltransferase C-terminal domain-containing protein [Candidatus Angelobacter sp.]
MLILGVQGGCKFAHEDDPENFSLHDSAAVLVRDGEILAGIEDERLSRIKHSNCFPVNAIRYCLEAGNCNLVDVDVIATNSAELYTDLAAKRVVLEDATWTTAPDARSYFAAPFRTAFGADIRDKIQFCSHHVAHAWSTFALSGFERSLVVSFDGDGDNSSGIVLTGEGQRLRKLQEFKVSQSLGHLYQFLIKFLGYERFDEYKVMGLAPYGDPRTFRNLFEQGYSLLPNGNYNIESSVTWLSLVDRAGLVPQSRRKGAPFTQVHKDFAAALQETVEKIALHVLRYFQQKTGERKLCLAGGVAHNCTMNGKILYSGLFDQVFVQPAAHDAGGALGAALGVWCENSPLARSKKLAHVYWGSHIGTDGHIAACLDRWSEFLSYKREKTIGATTARLIADGAVVGWVQGRSEFGPRALGNRSILADPRPAENKLRINEMVKKREQYRPFAPSVLEERLPEFFKVAPNQMEFPFMIFVLDVRENVRELLAAITHVDGTARVQSVAKSSNPEYWDLISEFEKITGVPILLNTSFNNHAEPIVDSVDDAVACFLTTGINYLVAGNYLVTKKSASEICNAILTLVPQMPPSRKLVKRHGHDRCAKTTTFYAIESTKSKHFGSRVCSISAPIFNLLQHADGFSDVRSLMMQCGISDEHAGELARELLNLWTQRIVMVSPSKRDSPCRQVDFEESIHEPVVTQR